MLHTINKSPFSHDCLTECLRVCNRDDVILLLEDGVYAALADSAWIAQLTAQAAAVYVLEADVAARGIAARIAPGIETVDYNGFVQLCVEQTGMLAWY